MGFKYHILTLMSEGQDLEITSSTKQKEKIH